MLQTTQPTLSKTAQISSDEHPYYEPLVQRICPDARYIQHKGEKSSLGGSGELKKVRFDPIFLINHTLAMLRANVCRLIRKTWNTTKKAARLLEHLWIYIDIHNQYLTA